MIFIIAFGMLVPIISWILNYDWWDDLGEILGGLLLMSIIGSLIGLAISILFSCIPLQRHWIQNNYVELLALQDNHTISGSFFLGSGDVNGKMKYYFYYKCQNGGYIMDALDVYNTKIFEYDMTPHILSYKQVYTKSIFNYLGLIYSTKHEIYIPKNSILRDIRLDLK